MGLGIRARLLEVAVTVKFCVSPAPAEMPARLIVCAAASSRIAAGLVIALSVGALLSGVTLTVKVRTTLFLPPLATPPLSVTVAVITAVPDLPETGV